MKKRPVPTILATGALAALLSSPLIAAPPAPSVESTARETLLDALAPALAARGATATVSIAPADSRRELAPCTQLSGFVPAGARLVGKTVIGVRCLDVGGWQTFVTVDVRINAPVWQATRALHAGDPLTNGDLLLGTALMSQADIEVAGATGRAGAVRGLASLDGRQPPPIGRTIQRAVGAGRALSAADIREEGRVNAGESVRVVYVGDGFTVSSEGRTVNPADPGSAVQIRLASGAVVSGTLRSDRQVELSR